MAILEPVNNISQSTDYNLKEITIYTTSSGKLDLIPYIVELNYFEDIYNCSVSGKIVLSEAFGVVRRNYLTGSELLIITFGSAFGGTPITKSFAIFSVSDRSFDIGNNFETYIINFGTDDLMISERYKISKSYPKTKISDIVTDILERKLKTGTPYEIQPTTGVYDFVISNKKIFHAVNWLAQYALPDYANSGADMLFFENNEGYKFKSLQSLYKQSPVYEYSYNPKNVNLSTSTVSKLESQRKNILSLEVLKNFDMLDSIFKGSYSNRLIHIDTITRKKGTQDFNYEKYFNPSSSLNNTQVLEGNASTYVDRFGKKLSEMPDGVSGGFIPAVSRVMVSNSERNKEEYINDKNGVVANDFFIQKYLPNRIAQLSLLNYVKIKIIVPGNSDILAGTTLNINILSSDYDSQTNLRKQDEYLSGKYLVTAVRHIINPSRYTTVVELAKDSKLPEQK